MNSGDIGDFLNAHETQIQNILEQQLQNFAAGIEPSNRVDVRGLGKRRRQELKEALKKSR